MCTAKLNPGGLIPTLSLFITTLPIREDNAEQSKTPYNDDTLIWLMYNNADTRTSTSTSSPFTATIPIHEDWVEQPKLPTMTTCSYDSLLFHCRGCWCLELSPSPTTTASVCQSRPSNSSCSTRSGNGS